MITAARTVSQIATHTLIAFGLVYTVTGSAAFGGVAALVEPVINVALLPLHQRAWGKLRTRIDARRGLAAEKLSQTLLHMAVAFLTMYLATGSAAFGGMLALVEPVCNVLVLPMHDRLWDRVRARLARGHPSAWVLA